MSIGRREFLGAAAGLAGQAQVGAQRAPNIVWIMADDLGYADVGCYGQKLIRTPNIDRLAAEGMRFTDAYAGCTVCAPSRSCLMTGTHMGHTTVRSNPGGVPLRAEDVTVAQILKRRGYATGLFGKWGLGDAGTVGAPEKKGFDESFGYLNQVHAHWYYPEFLYRNGQRFPLAGNANGQHKTYSHDVIAEQALGFVERHRANPFFLYVPFTLPHVELLVPEDSLASYRGKIGEEKPYVDPKKHYSDQPESRAAYAGMVSRMDRDVGRLMAAIQKQGLERDTLIFFTSDNGGATLLWGDNHFHSTGPFRGHKQNLYEGGIRVPMIARWPGKIAQGAVSHQPWAFWDFLPTAAELAGVEAPKGLDGISILPTLLGEKAAGRKQQTHEFFYWELPRYEARTGQFRRETPMQAVRTGNWKAVRPEPNSKLELYDLQQDIGETTDVADRHPDVMARITEFLRTARTEPLPQPDPPQDFRRTA